MAFVEPPQALAVSANKTKNYKMVVALVSKVEISKYKGGRCYEKSKKKLIIKMEVEKIKGKVQNLKTNRLKYYIYLYFYI